MVSPKIVPSSSSTPSSLSAGPGRTHVQQTLQSIEGFLVPGTKAGAFRAQNTYQLAVSIIGVHLFYFAGADTFTFIRKQDTLSPQLIRERRQAVREQVRARCGVSG